MVNVELEVNTSEDNVDMEAESTNTITTPIRISGSVDSIVGIIESYPSTARSEERRVGKEC